MKLKVICIIILFLLSCRDSDPMCDLNSLEGNKEANGIVESKRENIAGNGNCEHIYFTQGRPYVWFDENYEFVGKPFYSLIFIGDSIVKEEGSLEMLVYRKDTTFSIDLSFPCSK